MKAKNNCPDIIPNMPTECAPDNRRQPGISGKWKARPGMFGNKRNERGNGIQQPPWNATLFSLLKWEVRNRHKQLGNQPRKQSRGFAVYM